MKGGRNKKTVEGKVLRGTWDGSRERDKGLPLGELQETPPDWLGEVGKEEYRRLWPLVTRQVGAGDLGLLATYCDTFEAVQRCARVIHEEGESYIHPNGCPTLRPEAKLLQGHTRNLKSLAETLGLSPLTRDRASKIPEKPKGDPWDAV